MNALVSWNLPLQALQSLRFCWPFCWHIHNDRFGVSPRHGESVLGKVVRTSGAPRDHKGYTSAECLAIVSWFSSSPETLDTKWNKSRHKTTVNWGETTVKTCEHLGGRPTGGPNSGPHRSTFKGIFGPLRPELLLVHLTPAMASILCFLGRLLLRLWVRRTCWIMDIYRYVYIYIWL